VDEDVLLPSQQMLAADYTDDQPQATATFLIEEPVLRRPVGGPAVMRRQLDRLAEWSTRDNVEIQVVPAAVATSAMAATTATLPCADIVSPQWIEPCEWGDGECHLVVGPPIGVIVTCGERVAVPDPVICRFRTAIVG